MKKFSNIIINESIKTPCQTPGTQFHIEIKEDTISISIDLPMKLDLTEEDAKLLENNIHNAMELVISRYFD